MLQVLPSGALAFNRFSSMRLIFKQLNTVIFFALAYVLHFLSLKQSSLFVSPARALKTKINSKFSNIIS